MKQSIIYNTVITLLIGGAIVLFGFKQWQPKTCYVNIGEFLNEFKMAQELGQKFEQVSSTRTAQLDSMQLELERMIRSVSNGDKEAEAQILKKRELFFMRKEQFDSRNAELNAQYNSQILKRMNEYVQAFGEEHGYEFVHGAQGEGNILYASPEKDVTKEFIDYANRRYDGL